MLKIEKISAVLKSFLRQPASQLIPQAPDGAEQLQSIFRQLKPAFAAKDSSAFASILAQVHKMDACVVFDPIAPIHLTCFRLEIQDSRATFRFSTAETHEALTIMIVERWWSILPLVQRLIEVCGNQIINTIFNLNDEGVEAGLGFCDHRPEFSLIPDCVFIGTDGYREISTQYATQNVAWEDKLDVVFWRGTSTGRPSGERNELPRISLCRLCRSNASGIFDVALTGLVDHYAGEPPESELRSLMSDYVPWQKFDSYRYHIDIDGHTNSWPGLMFKLHSGGLVFKVTPPAGHRQWYYERLRPWVNYVPVKSDLSDLVDLVRFFRANPSLGRTIAEEGRRLAQSMEFRAELDVGVRTILGRCAEERYLRSQADAGPIS